MLDEAPRRNNNIEVEIDIYLKTEYVTMVIDDFLQFISSYMIFAYHSCSFLSFSTSAVLFLVYIVVIFRDG